MAFLNRQFSAVSVLVLAQCATLCGCSSGESSTGLADDEEASTPDDLGLGAGLEDDPAFDGGCLTIAYPELSVRVTGAGPQRNECLVNVDLVSGSKTWPLNCHSVEGDCSCSLWNSPGMPINTEAFSIVVYDDADFVTRVSGAELKAIEYNDHCGGAPYEGVVVEYPGAQGMGGAESR